MAQSEEATSRFGFIRHGSPEVMVLRRHHRRLAIMHGLEASTDVPHVILVATAEFAVERTFSVILHS